MQESTLDAAAIEHWADMVPSEAEDCPAGQEGFRPSLVTDPVVLELFVRMVALFVPLALTAVMVSAGKGLARMVRALDLRECAAWVFTTRASTPD
jgi:hypothetical protein